MTKWDKIFRIAVVLLLGANLAVNSMICVRLADAAPVENGGKTVVENTMKDTAEDTVKDTVDDTVKGPGKDIMGNAVEDVEINGEKVSVTDFLIEHLNEYIQSKDYLERKANYKAIFGGEENNFSVARVIEVSADDLGIDRISVHFLAVKANCWWAVDSNDVDYDLLLIVDYDSGKIYDKFTADDDWQNKDGSVEQEIWYLLHGILNSDDYDGGTIIIDSEKRAELAESEIAKINQALKQ
ncbi:MAG: hypothetical protein Q4E20_01710 [Eubacteriales bacterium]|nr:hypothetical protein [Eubacteriales bacterium]